MGSLPHLNYYGRRQILTDVKEITDENILEVLIRAAGVHEQNRQDIDFLWGYYKGKQNILLRQKEVRPEINNKIVENHAAEIVNFKTGFTFGEPVQYVYRGKNVENEVENVGDDKGIAYLNRLMDEEDKASKDSELAEWFYVCGVAYRMTLLEQNRLHIYICDHSRGKFPHFVREFLLGTMVLACAALRLDENSLLAHFSLELP